MAGGGSARGKDLRTTYSCPGVWKHDHGEIIPDDQGNHTTTCYVALDDAHRMTIGDAAENQVAMNPVTTDARRLIGRKYSSDSGLMFAPRNTSVNENSPSLPPMLPSFFATSSYPSTPLLQPFPPPTPSPFLTRAPPATPIPDFGPLYTREEVRDALLRVVQKDEVIDMFYQELHTPY